MLETTNQEYFDEVCTFARSIGLMDQLQGQLDYLATYGGPENKCALSRDFAPHSFTFSLYRPDRNRPDGWAFWFHGGLIYQGADSPAHGGMPSLTVSLAPGTGWFVHT